jgi:hypothetical protein
MTVATVAKALLEQMQLGQSSVATVASLYREARMATVDFEPLEMRAAIRMPNRGLAEQGMENAAPIHVSARVPFALDRLITAECTNLSCVCVTNGQVSLSYATFRPRWPLTRTYQKVCEFAPTAFSKILEMASSKKAYCKSVISEKGSEHLQAVAETRIDLALCTCFEWMRR